jgi:hypothetical protein
MPAKYIGIGVAVLIVLGGVVGWMSYQNSGTTGDSMMEKEGDAMMEESMEDEQSMESGAFSGSLSDLAKRGGNYKCTIAHESEAAQSSGTVYVAGDRIRGDFTSIVPQVGMTVETHMIQNGGYVYTWSPLTPNGFKAKTTLSESNTSQAMSGEYADFQQAYSYDCAPWSVDTSLFTPPSDVTFVTQ